MSGSMFLYSRKTKSQQFKLVDKVKKSKIKELEYLEVGDTIEIIIPLNKIAWVATNYAVPLTINVVNKGTSFTVAPGKFTAILDLFEIEDA